MKTKKLKILYDLHVFFLLWATDERFLSPIVPFCLGSLIKYHHSAFVPEIRKNWQELVKENTDILLPFVWGRMEGCTQGDNEEVPEGKCHG